MTSAPALISIAALERALSPNRLAGYRQPGDKDLTDGLARYIWNLALADAISPVLHAFELTLRNEVVRAAAKIVPPRITAANSAAPVTVPVFTPGLFPTWLDVQPTMLLDNELAKLKRAKSDLGSDRRTHTEGHLIAKLDLGFWVALLRKPYADARADGPRLWPAGLKYAFQHRPKHIKDAVDLFHAFDPIRMFRNRVAHHDPIWDRKYVFEHDRALHCLSWMNPTLAAAVTTISRAPAVFGVGPGVYRPLAEDILGAGPGTSADPIVRVVRALKALPASDREEAATAMLDAITKR
ncbi:MAG: hypothetical protein K2R93_14355 [Gemmatimonadaceae bacterium]|nr:hypothetical protein [Gemmatimonadaceae bacterium]